MSLDAFEYKVMGVAADFLKEHSDRISNDVCNDWDFPKEWTDEDKTTFVKAFHDWNGDPEEFNPENLRLSNSAACGFIAAVIKQTIEDKGF